MSPPPREIKGGRPVPLKIHKDSQSIHKASSPSFSSSSSSIAPAAAVAVASSSQPQQRRHHQPPVIIYTHSPKVIHTNARDFMALVQKLTGLTRSPEENNSSSSANPQAMSGGVLKNNGLDELHDENSSSSVKCSSFLNDMHGSSSSLSGTAVSPLSLELPHSLPDPFVLSEMASDFFCSATNPFYRYADHSSVLSPGIPNLDEIMNSYNDL